MLYKPEEKVIYKPFSIELYEKYLKVFNKMIPFSLETDSGRFNFAMISISHDYKNIKLVCRRISMVNESC